MILALATNMISHHFPPERKCLWPFGDPRDPGFRFCEQVVETPGPYCDDCRKLAYREPGEFR